MAHYKIEAVVESDREEGNFELFVEGLLKGQFPVKDYRVFEVTWLPPIH